MQSPRAPLYVFLAAFLTFLLAFGTLLAVLKPAIDKKQAENKVESDRSKQEAVIASLAPTRRPDGGKREPRGETQGATVTAEIRGRVVDSRSSGIPGAVLHLLVASGGKSESAYTELLAQPAQHDGTFSFRATLPLTGVLLQATAPGHVRSERKMLAYSGGPNIEVGSLTLKPGGSLRVRVSGSDAGNLGNASVALLGAAESSGPIAPPDITARAENDGIALLRGIDVGRYRVQVTAPGHANSEVDWRYDGDSRNGTEDLPVVLLPLCAYVTGNAYDLDRAPLTSGEVAIKLARPDPPAPQEWRGKLGRDGQFRIGPVPRGTFSLELVASGMVQTGETFAESDGDPVEILAEHCSTITGRIQAPLEMLTETPHISVWKVEPNGRMQPFEGAYRAELNTGTTNFHVEGLGPGRYVVRVAVAGFAACRSAPFSVVVDKASDPVVVKPSDGGIVTGRIVDPRGAPIADARISVFEGTAPPPPALADLYPADTRTMLQTGNDGSFEFTRLSPGAIVLLIEAAGQAARTIGPLFVEEGGEARLGALTLGGGAILLATINDRGSKPLPFGRGLLTTGDRRVHAPFIADEDGNFCLRGLADGDYIVSGSDGAEGRSVFTLRANETGRVQVKLR